MTHAAPPPSAPPQEGTRLRVAGKFFRLGDAKVFVRGVSYGPFRPNAAGEPFPDTARLVADLEHIRDLGFNTVRVYHPPTDTLLAEATRLDLRLIAGIAWTDHVDFLADRQKSARIRADLVREVRRLGGEPCVAAVLVGNEIEKTLVRWMGPRRVQRFVESLIDDCREAAPGLLFSYATYPSTEYLVPRNADFLAVNVYLEDPAALAAYLQRLQNLAGSRPLVITEFGLDTAAHGEKAQAAAVRWEHDTLQAAGAAGNVWFSYTDEWFRGGAEVTGWSFGLVDAARRPRLACAEMARMQRQGHPEPSAADGPRFSVIVCTYNGTATLEPCLASLEKLRYPNHEVLLIDDGSTLDIGAVAKKFPRVRYVRQDHAGLSVARNLGASLATGDILAYTDDDCLADEDWLGHLARAFDDPRWVAAGGPNIPPPPRNRTEATVAAAPGAPAHVLLTDLEAEHLPGCNLAVRKAALLAVGGFRAQYQVAGDDVDICWRLREAGGSLRFVPAAMVWHHRRYTVAAYLRQQRGYGHAEALLMKDHPERFGPLGGARWRGGIYGDQTGVADLAEGAIFHGPFGNGLFQGIYQHGPRCLLDWMSGVLWAALALAALAADWRTLAILLLAGSFVAAACRMRLLPLPPFALNLRGKALLLGLCWLQPMVREWQRLCGMIRLGSRPSWQPRLKEVFIPRRPRKFSWPLWTGQFWSEAGAGREQWLAEFLRLLKEQKLDHRLDDGWRWFDVELHPRRWVSTGFMAVSEYHGQGRCLTRVRVTQRVSKGLLMVWGLLLLLPCLGTGLLAALVGLGVLALPAVCLVTAALTARSGAARAALAAQGAGLHPAKS